MERQKILVIGLDGGTWTVLEPAIQRGYMPFLSRLIERGSSGVLESTIPAITPAAWAAFQTGKNPGQTGVFNFSWWDKHNKTDCYMRSSDLGQTVWDVLSQNGKRLALLDVPMTYPPREINGYIISGCLLAPSLESEFTWPASLKAELLKAVPDYQFIGMNTASQFRSDSQELERFIQQMVSYLNSRTDAAIWLLDKEPFDLFMVHFLATDGFQHVYWHFLDNSHPLFDASMQTLIFEKFYRVVDQKIEQIHNAFSEKNGTPLTIVISDHGFQSHSKRFNLGNWLEMEGYLKTNPRSAGSIAPFLKKITRTLRLGKLLSRIISPQTIRSVDQTFLSQRESFCWERSVAYSVGRSAEGFIYLLDHDENKKREVAEALCGALATLVDPETKAGIVKKVWHKEDLYHGDQMDRLPDLVLEPAEGWSFSGNYQAGAGLVHRVNTQDDMHIGKHHVDGIFVLSGDTPGDAIPKRIRIVDLAPLMLHFLGCPIPEDMDGRIDPAIQRSGILRDGPIVFQGGSPERTLSEEQEYSEQDTQAIEKRLRDLGYL